MTTLAQVALLLTLLAEPVLALAAELASHLRARRARAAGRDVRTDRRVPAVAARPAGTDYTVVVPLPGDPADLDRLGRLHDEGARVLLVTTGTQSPDFYRRLWAVAGEHGFRVHVAGPERRSATDDPAGPRSVRTALLHDAHTVLTSEYVVCVDPGTVLDRPPGEVVAALVAAGLDLGTVATGVAPVGLLARVQRLEDALAAHRRRRLPWLVPGGVHVARRTLHADLLRRHTGFGPGDDLETAVLAGARGHRVGHLDVRATQPGAATARAWWAQRVMWAAGVFRVAVVNLPVGVRRPTLHLGDVAAASGLVPLLWWAALDVPWVLPAVVVLHGALTAAATRTLRDPVAWLSGVHALLRAFLLRPAGAVVWAVTAVRAGEAGVLRDRDAWWAREPADAPVVRRLPGPGPARASDWWAHR